jgi:uncharacterized membrane protein
MTTMEHEVIINSTMETVDAVATDVTHWPEWYPGIERAVPDANYPQVGSVVDVKYKAAGVSFNLTFTVSDYDYLNTIAFDITGMMTGNTRFTISQVGNGVRVVGHFDYEVPGGGLGKIADKLVVERMNNQNLENSLKNLKRVIEG